MHERLKPCTAAGGVEEQVASIRLWQIGVIAGETIQRMKVKASALCGRADKIAPFNGV